MGGILAPCSHPTFILPRSEVLAPSIGCVIRPHIVKYHHPISFTGTTGKIWTRSEKLYEHAHTTTPTEYKYYV